MLTPVSRAMSAGVRIASRDLNRQPLLCGSQAEHLLQDRGLRLGASVQINHNQPRASLHCRSPNANVTTLPVRDVTHGGPAAVRLSNPDQLSRAAPSKFLNKAKTGVAQRGSDISNREQE